ncbi:Rdx family protein, partial [Salmonella sp. s54836]|uniref:Rdx family protein n=1 Tax=Salmonella sp. s54836 TaxID=3159673 RepID=UPI003980CF85
SKVVTDKINFTNTRAAGVTGEFEVTFTKAGNKDLIYSKKATGKFPNTDADIEEIIKKINA